MLLQPSGTLLRGLCNRVAPGVLQLQTTISFSFELRFVRSETL